MVDAQYVIFPTTWSVVHTTSIMRPSNATVERAQQQHGAVFCKDRKQKEESSRGLRLLPQSKSPGKTMTSLLSEAFARLAAGSRTPVEEALARLAPDVHMHGAKLSGL